MATNRISKATMAAMAKKGFVAQPKRKYRNKITFVDGRRFDSKKEANHFEQILKPMLANGMIRDLVFQPKFPIVLCGKKICTYVADFKFLDVALGRTRVVDVKGMRTPIYRLKKKIVEALYQIEIEEV